MSSQQGKKKKTTQGNCRMESYRHILGNISPLNKTSGTGHTGSVEIKEKRLYHRWKVQYGHKGGCKKKKRQDSSYHILGCCFLCMFFFVARGQYSSHPCSNAHPSTSTPSSVTRADTGRQRRSAAWWVGAVGKSNGWGEGWGWVGWEQGHGRIARVYDFETGPSHTA